MKRAIVLAALAVAAAAQQHTPIPPERIHRYERQEIVLKDFDAEGFILDIGGGGEGVIGQLKGQQVVAVDLIKRELEEAPPGPLKIVMDATDLKFVDGSFKTATSFFSLMYMKPADQEKCLREVHRVLAPGGRFLIWEVSIPKRFGEAKEIAVFPLTIKLPGTEVTTGYGTRFPPADHDLAYFANLAEAAGFRVKAKSAQARNVYLELEK